MSLIDTSTNSPHYFYWKHIGTTNENNNFNIRVKRVKSTRDLPPLFALGLLHTYLDIFESATFSASVHTYPVNPAYESATFWIRSPEWKFLNELWIRNRVDGKFGNFFFSSSDVTRSRQVIYREYSRWCRAKCFRFFTSKSSVSSLITCVQLNLTIITVHFSYAWRNESESVYLWTSKFDLNTLRLDVQIFESSKKNLRNQ